MRESLTNTALRGLFWSFAERGGSQLIQLIVSVLLARLLLPEEFGLMAILAVFISISNMLVDAGFSQALIQKQDATFVDECSVFYCNILLSLLLAVIFYLAAPLIAEFYGYSQLASLGRVLSFNIIVGALGAVHFTLLTKRLEFKTQSIVSIISLVLSGGIGIVMAVRGFGVWSLAAQSVSSTLIRTMLVWCLHSWRPNWIISLESLRSMFPYGSRLLFSNLLSTVSDNLFALVIGKVYSAKDLGFYSRAEQLKNVPVINLTTAVNRIALPVFSIVQDDELRLKRGVQKAVMALAAVNFPIMIGIAIVAEPLILLLFTEKWLPSVLFFQLMCVVGMLYPLHAINLTVLKAQGRSDLFLRLEIIKRILQFIGLLFTFRSGISVMLLGAIVVSLIGYYINTYYVRQLIGYSFSEQVKDIGPSLVLATLMGASIYPFRFLVQSNQLALLTIQAALGAVIYVGLCRLFRLQPFMASWEALKNRNFLSHRKN